MPDREREDMIKDITEVAVVLADTKDYLNEDVVVPTRLLQLVLAGLEGKGREIPEGLANLNEDTVIGRLADLCLGRG